MVIEFCYLQKHEAATFEALLKPWLSGCGSSVGAHGTKKAARMLGISQRHIDSFRRPRRRQSCDVNAFVVNKKRLTEDDETPK